MNRMKKSTLYIVILALFSTLFTTGLFLRDFFSGGENYQNNPPIIVTPNPPSIEIKDMILFNFENLDENFAIINLSITSQELVDLKLSDIKTSEGKSLTETKYIREQLILLGANLEVKKIVDELPIDSTSYSVNILVPIKDKSLKELSLKIAKYNFEYSFNLDSYSGTREMLGIVDDTKIVDEDEFTIKILDVSDLTGKTVFEVNSDNTKTPIDFPSTAKIHAIFIEVDPKNSGIIKIIGARYRILTNNESSDCLPSNNTVENLTNLLNVEISIKTTGYIFFDIYSSNQSLIDKQAEFEFKLNTSDEWYKVQVID